MDANINIKHNFSTYTQIFLCENSKHNLISHNDEKLLYEKHIYDSLSIKLFFEKYGTNFKEMLDIGCGGGFPCVPIALEFPDINVTGIDSIKKKIQSVENIKKQLNIKNLNLICDRVENIKNKKFDLIVSRAVGDLSKILQYGIPILKKDGFFIAYKSKKTSEELSNAESTLKILNASVIDMINYVLPTEEQHQRTLICIKRN